MGWQNPDAPRSRPHPHWTAASASCGFAAMANSAPAIAAPVVEWRDGGNKSKTEIPVLKSSVMKAVSADTRLRGGMYALFRQYYEGVSESQFERDLAAKDTLLILRDDAGVLRGFSTLAVSPHVFGGAAARVVFSGDTIIERAFWGSPAFSFSWLRHIAAVAAEAPAAPLYWLLTVKGHRTYRYLPAFARVFVPDWRGRDEPGLAALRDDLAVKRFGAAYHREAGILRCAQPAGRLAPEWAAVSAREARRPDVGFFLRRNPGYALGDELVCLCPLSPDNMQPLARRIYLGANPA